MEQRDVEKLNCIRNEMTHLWGSAFLIGGGAVCLYCSTVPHSRNIALAQSVLLFQ